MDTDNTNDAAAMSHTSVCFHGPPFTERLDMARAALNWCDRHNVERLAVNIVSALFRLGLVQKPQPALTDEERLAIREALEGYCENDDDPECNRIAWILSGLLQRTK